MNGYALIAAVVQSTTSLGWPAALFGIVWLFRKRLDQLLPQLRLKYKDFETSFRLDQAEREAAALPSTPVDAETKPTPEETNRIEKLSEISPRAAIMEVRRELEEAVNATAREYGLPLRRPNSFVSSIRMLRSRELIDQHTSALLDDLRALGNAAAHGGSETEFSKKEALRYHDLANEIIRILEAQVAFRRVPLSDSNPALPLTSTKSE